MDLLEAIDDLGELQAKKLRFFIVGDRPSPYSDKMHERFEALPPHLKTRTHLVPETPQIGRFFLGADIFLFTSYFESFPKVIQEAMYFGLPILTTPVFGISEQVQDEVSALFFEPGDFKGLNRQLSRLVASPELRKKLGARAKISLGKLPTYPEMTSKYLSIFKEAWLSGGPRMPENR
jgi:glycosyltransferase involved in cell wall biosynthesis